MTADDAPLPPQRDRFALAAGMLAMGTGLAVLVGWAAGIGAVKSLIPRAVEMKANTSVGLLLAGTVVALDELRVQAWTLRWRRLLVALVAALGTLTLAQYATGLSFGIDEALFRDTGRAYNAVPGRMSSFTAAAFVLLSVVLALRGRGGWAAQARVACAAQVAAIGAIAVLGYILGATELVTDQWAAPVAVHTGAVLLVLALALVRSQRHADAKRDPISSLVDRRLLLAFSGLVVVLLAMAGATYRFNAGFADAAQWVAHTQQVRLELARVEGCVLDVESRQRRNLLLEHHGSQLVTAEEGAGCLALADAVVALVADNPAQQARAVDLRRLSGQRLESLASIVQLFEASGGGAVRAALAAAEGPRLMAAIKALVRSMDTQERVLLQERQARQAWQRSAMLVSLLATLALFMAMCAFTLRTVNRHLRESSRLRWCAEEAARTKAAFLSSMSHEIRTPMTGVLGLVDLLAAEPLEGRQREYVRSLHASGRHLLTVVNDILDYSRIEAGTVEIERIDFSIAEVTERVRSSLHANALERGIALHMHVDEQLAAPVSGDPTRLTQVLLNLVSNALKFTQQGSVTVTVSRVPAPGLLVRFEVRDTGIGIAADTLPRLFTPFVQADSSTARQFGGSGLGLAICKRLVEAMGGNIEVQSEPGCGSQFAFVLRYGPAQSAIAPTPVAATETSAVPRRLLVAEDVPTNRDILRTVLERHGHRVTFAENGATALELAEGGDWDLVLMDVQMPTMDGVEATRRIRRLPGAHGSVPIVGLTANVLAEERRGYLEAGMADCITKPIHWPHLHAAIARHARPAGAPLPTPGKPAGVEKQAFDALRKAVGDAKARSLLQDGLRTYGQYCDWLDRDIATPAAVAAHAHKIKGSAGTLGLLALTEAAAVVEAEALAGTVRPDCTRLMRGLLASAQAEIATWA